MKRSRAWAWAALAVATSALAACQAVSGIAGLDIVDDAGDAHASDATMEASPTGDGADEASGDATADATVETGPDATADTQADTGPDATSSEGGVDAAGDADGGVDATADAGSGADAADGGGASDAAEAGDATDAGDAAGDAATGTPCQFGWQCPAGYCAGGGCGEPPSCAGLPATCGPNGTDDCCRSLSIVVTDAGVPYYRSYDSPNYTSMANPATMAGPFALDKYEVTVERFEKFIAAYDGGAPATGSGSYPPVAGTGWDPSWPVPASQSALVSAVTTITASCTQPFAPAAGQQPATAHLPMNCVDWYLAFAFCAWDGSRLPTEAEWNFAAAGATAARAYPWLATMAPPQIDSTYAWYDCTGPMGTKEPGGVSGPCTQTGNLPVGSESPKGDALYGHVDMAGSMLEPTLDFFGSYPNPCTNCVNTNAGSGQRVYRGGSWSDPPGNLDDGYRTSFAPTSGASTLGIRCAR